MSSPFVAEVRIVGFNFPPTGWAFCNGQILPLSQNTALFSLLGTTYGGNGMSTFALPNFQGNVPLHPDDNSYLLGQTGGSETVTLELTEIPFHTHTVRASGASGDNPGPSGNSLARYANVYQTNTSANLTQLAPQALPVAGGDFPHNNMQPYLTLNFVIALQGVFPPRG